MTPQEIKALPRGTKVLRTHDFHLKRKKTLVYVKTMDGFGGDSCCFNQVKENGTIVRRDQYLHCFEVEHLPVEKPTPSPEEIRKQALKEALHAAEYTWALYHGKPVEDRDARRMNHMKRLICNSILKLMEDPAPTT